MDYRIEHDSMGDMQVPADKYWGAQTQRSHENFPIGVGQETMPMEIIHAFGILKKAAAQANAELRPEKMTQKKLAAISAAGNPASVISDGSQGNIDKITLGKTSACTNSGTVSGDVNTGGIAGSIAIEYELDPEDDVSANLDGEYRRQYEYRAVVQQCANTGAVSAKRSNTGGIAGRMDLGLIISCESYGSVESDSGSCVGGIAGLTAATVRSSYAKCTLSGKKYVGGIVGSGVAERSDGSASTVTGRWWTSPAASSTRAPSPARTPVRSPITISSPTHWQASTARASRAARSL